MLAAGGLALTRLSWHRYTMVLPAAVPSRALPLRAEPGAASSMCSCAENRCVAAYPTCSLLQGELGTSAVVYLDSAVHPARHDALVPKKPDPKDICVLPTAVFFQRVS